MILLLAPALWNGYPLLQYDTGGYLARWYETYLVPSRSTVFGLYLHLGEGLHFWPQLILQAGCTLWIIGVMLRVTGLGSRPRLYLLVVAVLAVTTSVPFLTSVLLTDIFIGLAVLGPLQPLQDKLVAEMRSHVKEDDPTVPVYEHGWWHWRRFQTGAEYGQFMRRRGGPEAPDESAPEELMLDEAALAKGHAYYKVGAAEQSPDGRWLAWAEDTTGRRIYTLRFKDLKTGQVLPDRIRGVLPDVVWANDNRSLYYLRQDKTTLQADAVMRHRLGEARNLLVFKEPDKTLYMGIGLSASRSRVLIQLEGYDRTETSSGSAASPKFLPVTASICAMPAFTSSRSESGNTSPSA
mgnify:CR=1 FL=1